MVAFLEQSSFVDVYGEKFNSLRPIQRRFLQLYPYNVTIEKTGEACRLKAGRKNHYTWMKEPHYRECFRAVQELITQAMEEEALRRGVHGCEEDIFFQGQVCGTKRVFSDQLLIFMLRARRPDVYRERSSIDLTTPPTPAEDSPFNGLSKPALISIKQIINQERQKNKIVEAQPQEQNG